MRDGMIRVETYGTELEAEMALGQLQAMGISGFLEIDDAGGMAPSLDAQRGVSVLTYPEDAAQARAILAGQGGDGSGAWSCPACGSDGEPGYDACWNCGRERM
ncbi:MAG: hypothetical protein IPO18_15855 [bacterium]|jgi:hypothetical protein|nr:hypothetical protein [bacterium]MBK7045628.1 hypothetical protein [bacterium]MBK7190017.1 hypothetical protein [bacterium]MBK7671894.1 hypothetical protein [bacterium]MBK7769937.1 hypothetical protein [bacterium]